MGQGAQRSSLLSAAGSCPGRLHTLQPVLLRLVQSLGFREFLAEPQAAFKDGVAREMSTRLVIIRLS